MIIVYGGRNDKGAPLNDCWGLRKHRNGNWDWVSAPYDEEYEPQKRFQHTITFYYNFLIHRIHDKCFFALRAKKWIIF